MHRDRIERDCLADMERGLRSDVFALQLRERGATRDGAAGAISQVFGVSLGAARLFVRSHPAWDPEDRAESGRIEGIRR
jgi:hypothetical protein